MNFNIIGSWCQELNLDKLTNRSTVEQQLNRLVETSRSCQVDKGFEARALDEI